MKPIDRKRECHSACDVLPTHRAVLVCVTRGANGAGRNMQQQGLDEEGRDVNRECLQIQDGQETIRGLHGGTEIGLQVHLGRPTSSHGGRTVICEAG